jgi:signal transduction histidine kinase
VTIPKRPEVGIDVKDQDRVLSLISHEIRAPLTAMRSFAELLADERLGGELNETQRAAVKVIIRNAKRLLRLVDDLSLLTRLDDEPTPLVLEPLDVSELVRTAVVERMIDVESRRVSFVCDAGAGPPLLGDADRLRQVLDNVLGNAVKFGADDDAIRVTAKFADPVWTIEVADSGIGIPPEELPGIAGSFHRGSNAVSAGIAGSGLGLAISREVVERHGGTLRIESSLGAGTTVRITLPRQGLPPA